MQVGLLILAAHIAPPKCGLVTQAYEGSWVPANSVCDRGTWYLRVQLQRLQQHTTPMSASCSSCFWRRPWMQVRVQ